MHNIGYIHLDLKPDNVLIGSGDLQNHRSRMIYLIDFGISRKYREPDGTHVPFRVDVPFTGNLVFSSVNSFLSYELSRRDDLESLLYLLTYLGIGNLPWICLMSAKSQSVSSHLIK
jgi:serine/threonine protein kinase